MASGFVPELLVDLRDAPARSLGQTLTASLRDRLRDGVLPPGTALPGARALGAQLGISRGTVAAAFDQLHAEGLIELRTRHAPRVCAAVPPAATAAPSFPDPLDLHPASPDLALFPRRAWTRHYADAVRTAPERYLGYRPSQGEPALRDELAQRLVRTRAARTSSDAIVVCAGFTQGLRLVADVLCAARVQRVAVEQATLPDTARVLRAAGLTPVPVPVDAAGMEVDPLAALDVGAVVVTPAHQFPLGVTLSGQRRRHLLDWAADADALVIEDDYDSDFRYDRAPTGCLQGLDPDRVLLLGTVSKTLAPVLRLGWIAAPPRLLPALAAAKNVTDGASPTLDQLALAGMLSSGDLHRHIRRAARHYARRRDALIQALGSQLPDVAVTGSAAGVYVLVHLPDGVDDHIVSQRLLTHRVRAPALSALLMESAPRMPAAIVLGYAGLHPQDAPHVVAQLRSAIDFAATNSLLPA